MDITSVPLFFSDTIAGRIAANPTRAKKIGGIFEFVIEGEGGGTWTLDLNQPELKAGRAEKMNCRIRMAAADFLDLVNGKLNEMAAFTARKLKVEGNIALALKLREVLNPQGW